MCIKMYVTCIIYNNTHIYQNVYKVFSYIYKSIHTYLTTYIIFLGLILFRSRFCK